MDALVIVRYFSYWARYKKIALHLKSDAINNPQKETTTMQSKLINLDQGSKEWLEYRKTRIGASDYPAIIGISPYKSRKDLLLDKLGHGKQLSEFQKNIFKLGHEWETKVRTEKFSQFYPYIAQSKDHERFFCSLDGKFGDTILEIKSTSSDNILDQVKSGIIPDHFQAQIDFQLFASGLSQAILAVIDTRTSELFVIDGIKQSKEIDIPACYSFLDELDSSVMPIVQLENETMQRIAATKALIDKLKKEINKEESNIKKMCESLLEQFSDAIEIQGHGVRIFWQERKGAVNYDDIPELKNVNLENYRKPNSRSIQITVLKGKKENEANS